MNHSQKGYILFITFSILALCTALVSAFMMKGMTHKKIAMALLEQEKINQFLLSTPALAQSYLYFSADEVEPAAKDDGPEKSADGAAQGAGGFAKKLLDKLLPVVNKTQKFMIKGIEKDFPVVVSLTFFCESGKINVNGLYDLVENKFYDEGVEGKDQKVFATVLFDQIAKITGHPSLLNAFAEYMKQRKLPFNDVTELLAIPEFATCFAQDIFYQQPTRKENEDAKNQKIFLTDIFTVASENDTIQPWLLSPSLCVLLGIAPSHHQQDGAGQQEDKKIDTSGFQPQANWAKDWDTTIKSIYEISYDKLPDAYKIKLAPTFAPTTFSLLISVEKEVVAGENNMKKEMFAILKEKKLPDNSINYDVIKLYQV